MKAFEETNSFEYLSLYLLRTNTHATGRRLLCGKTPNSDRLIKQKTTIIKKHKRKSNAIDGCSHNSSRTRYKFSDDSYKQGKIDVSQYCSYDT